MNLDIQIQTIASKLSGFAISLTKNPYDASDLIQDTIVKALTNKDKFKEDTNLKAWMSTIMKNTFLSDRIKLSNKKPHYEIDEHGYLLNHKIDDASSEATFINEDIENAMSVIKDDLKDVFLMHYEGYKYEEISETLQIPLGTVKNRIHLARKHLQKNLAQYA